MAVRNPVDQALAVRVVAMGHVGLAQASSMKTKRRGQAWPGNAANAPAPGHGWFSSAACKLFPRSLSQGRRNPRPHGGRRHSTMLQLGHHRSKCQVGLLGDPRQQPLPWPTRTRGSFLHHGLAAALPVARWRCNQFTTDARLPQRDRPTCALSHLPTPLRRHDLEEQMNWPALCKLASFQHASWITIHPTRGILRIKSSR